MYKLGASAALLILALMIGCSAIEPGSPTLDEADERVRFADELYGRGAYELAADEYQEALDLLNGLSDFERNSFMPDASLIQSPASSFLPLLKSKASSTTGNATRNEGARALVHWCFFFK